MNFSSRISIDLRKKKIDRLIERTIKVACIFQKIYPTRRKIVGKIFLHVALIRPLTVNWQQIDDDIRRRVVLTCSDDGKKSKQSKDPYMVYTYGVYRRLLTIVSGIIDNERRAFN